MSSQRSNHRPGGAACDGSIGEAAVRLTQLSPSTTVTSLAFIALVLLGRIVYHLIMADGSSMYCDLIPFLDTVCEVTDFRPLRMFPGDVARSL